MSVKVSVIVPVYGVEKYMERCARSLFAQTLDHVEFLFIDDCTPDRSMEILQAEIERHRDIIAEQHWDVRTYRMHENSGQAAVRKQGISMATGQYIAHCDSDDWVEPTIYEKLYNKASAENLDILWCDFYSSDGVKSISCNTLQNTKISKKRVFDAMFCDNTATHSLWAALVSARLYSKEILFPTHNIGEDNVFMAQLLFFADTIGYLPEPLYYYYQNPGSIMHPQTVEKRWNNFWQSKKNRDIVIEFFENYNVPEKYTTFQKLSARFELENLRNEKNFKSVWHSTYPELEGHILLNTEIPFRHRVKYFLMESGLHKWFYNLFRKISKI